jgi:hypothetical protein
LTRASIAAPDEHEPRLSRLPRGVLDRPIKSGNDEGEGGGIRIALGWDRVFSHRVEVLRPEKYRAVGWQIHIHGE